MATFMLNKDGRLEVFIIGNDKAIWHKWQLQPGGQEMGDWKQLNPGDNYTALSVTSNLDGRIEVFALREDGMVRDNWQTTPNGNWSGWADRGSGFKAIRSARNADGTLAVVALGSDDRIYYNSQTSPGGGWASNPPQSWRDLSMNDIGLDVQASQIEVKLNAPQPGAPGVLEVFAIEKSSGGIQMKWQDATGPGGWAPSWYYVGSTISGFTALSVAMNQDGRLEAFALKEDHSVKHNAQLIPGAAGTFQEWADLGAPYTTLSAGRDDQGRLNVVARNMNDGLYYTCRQQSPGGSWTTWTLVSPASVDSMPSGFASGLGGFGHRHHRRKLKLSVRSDSATDTPDPNVQKIQDLWNDALQNGEYCIASMLATISTFLPGASVGEKCVGGLFTLASCNAMNNDLDQILDILHDNPSIQYHAPEPSGPGPETIQNVDESSPSEDE